MYVNRESREVGLRFYRVHIPCFLQMSKGGIERATKAILYFNPVYAFIHLKARGPEHSLVDFLRNLEAHDLQDIGLLNLALDANSITHLHSMLIKAIMPYFNILKSDLRPIGPGLSYVLTASSHLWQIRIRWRETLRKWDVRPQSTKELVFFEYDPPSYEEQICDIQKRIDI
jgi:hypothetical protein